MVDRSLLALALLVSKDSSVGGDAYGVAVALVNDTGLARRIVAAASTEAARLLEPAGVRPEWGAAPSASGIRVTLVECGDPAAPPCRPGVLGSAVGDRRTRAAGSIFVYVDRVVTVASRSGCPATTLLGRVLAHELVHLLAGPGAHDDDGLMRAEWPAWSLALPVPSGTAFSPRTRRRLQVQASGSGTFPI